MRNLAMGALLGALMTTTAAMAETFPRVMSTSSPPPQTVVDFLDSVGVNTHWNYTDTPYGYSYDQISQLLIDSGIKHMRAGCDDPAGNGSSVKAIEDLRQRGQIQSMASFEPDYGAISAQIACVKTRNANKPGSVVAIEGPNEPDLFWAPAQTKTYQGQGFPDGPKNFLCDVFAAVNADPAVASLPVVSLSLGRTYGTAPQPYGTGALTPCVDYGNHHPYAAGEPFQTQFAYGGLDKYPNDANNPGSNIAEWQHYYAKNRTMTQPKPMFASEAGYSTYNESVTEALHAKYMSRLWFEYFRKKPSDPGFTRTYAYEFADEFQDPGAADDREAHFGLVRWAADNQTITVKPAYTAVKNILARLRAGLDDPPITSSVTSVGVTINAPAGYGRTELVRSLLLERTDGGYALALWHEISGQDRENPGTILTHPAIPVTVQFNGGAVSAKRYALTGTWGFALANSYANPTSVNITVDEKLQILFFR